MQEILYHGANHPLTDPDFSKSSNETLAVIAQLVVQEFSRGHKRRVTCIVTLNADDMLEQAVLKFSPPKRRVLSIVERPSREVIYKTAAGLPIGVYHIHGFIPSDMKKKHGGYPPATDMLVFTDAQNWNTTATALAFANRVMASALNEGPCIFIGLSMTDINLLRWLGLRFLEWQHDAEEEGRKSLVKRTGRATGKQEHIRKTFNQHFWIRPHSADPLTEFLTDFLALRGIHAVELEICTQGSSFKVLMKDCFPRSRSR